MATCIPCAEKDHVVCMLENEGKTTGCPGCCQHRETEVLIIAGEKVLAPKGVKPVMPK
jgi:hypothetical protein